VAETGANGVLDDVTAGLEEVALVVDDPRREAVGEQVSKAAMAFVELLRVAAVQQLEPA
jgi:hypothetical protein